MKLSVVMPIGRIDQFLEETILSVDGQTYRDFELIMVCDTGIRLELEQFIRQVPVTFSYRIIDTKLRGVAFAANLAIAAAGGEYIARWDSDDLCDPIRFARQVNMLDGDRTLGVVGTRVQIIDEYGHPVKYQALKFYPDNKSIRSALKYRQPLLHSSLIFRSEILFGSKGYLYGHASEDHELFIRIARDESIIFENISDVLTYYRRHSAQLSDVSCQKKHFYEIGAFMFSEFLRTYDPMYLFGIIVNTPVLRKLRHSYRKLRIKFSHL